MTKDKRAGIPPCADGTYLVKTGERELHILPRKSQ
jgi:hypothetical protein